MKMFYKYFNNNTEYELNSLQEIRDIKNPEKVQYLDLSNNNITDLGKNIFDKLIHLQHLDLSNNNITEVDKDIYKYNKELQTILLSQKLKCIDKICFDYNIDKICFDYNIDKICLDF